VANKKTKSSKSKKNKLQTTTPSGIDSTRHEDKRAIAEKTERKGSYLSRPIFPGSWKTNAAIFLLLIIATQVLYATDLNLGFFSIDDEGYVIKNPWIRSVSFQNLSHILTTPYFSNFSPVHLLSYMLDYAIAGSNAFAFHLSSNIWAGLVASFVFLVALAFTGRRIIAVAAALLFIVHPAHVEAIAWISSRKDLVAAAFALPSLLAYLRYRKGGPSATRWYIISLLLFLFAVAGKVSVAIFPVVFLALDLFVEKRSLRRSIIDKVPFLLATAIIALVVYSAQPLSGNPPDPYVFSASLGQSLWLLTGFGKYVIYRLRPEPSGLGFEIVSIVFLLALFITPLLLRRRFPLAMALMYWILFGWLPAQVLSFVHPVTDRYLFFPSIAAVILIAWGIITIGGKLGRKGLTLSLGVLLIVAFLWGRGTLNYLSEWKDPRSVWYAAQNKSSDPDVPYSLGGHYLRIAGQLGVAPQGEPLSGDKAKLIASSLWANDPGLPKLLSEWQENKRGGPVEREFQNYLWGVAWDNFEKALVTRGTHVFPNLYFSRGKLLLDKGDLEGAKREFLASLQEASLSSVKDVREEVTVSSHNALGAIAWREGNFRESLKWYKMAEEEQSRFGGNWIPDISSSRKRSEATVAMLPGSAGITAATSDPEVAYNLGLHYLDIASQLGTTPAKLFSREACELLAKDVWSANNELQSLIGEWNKGQHGGVAENAFQNYLKNLAWQAFEGAVTSKGNRIMPQLYFRRGMMLGERGDAQGAKKEFFAAIDEAAKDTSASIKQQYIVSAHDALGILAWRAADYTEALNWFQKAEQEQKTFGGNWVPDISSKKQRMETMINSKPAK
jgi:hypothetical protein